MSFFRRCICIIRSLPSYARSEISLSWDHHRSSFYPVIEETAPTGESSSVSWRHTPPWKSTARLLLRANIIVVQTRYCRKHYPFCFPAAQWKTPLGSAYEIGAIVVCIYVYVERERERERCKLACNDLLFSMITKRRQSVSGKRGEWIETIFF